MEDLVLRFVTQSDPDIEIQNHDYNSEGVPVYLVKRKDKEPEWIRSTDFIAKEAVQRYWDARASERDTKFKLPTQAQTTTPPVTIEILGMENRANNDVYCRVRFSNSQEVQLLRLEYVKASYPAQWVAFIEKNSTTRT